jgi:transcriptional regulator with XRE-family HTH domain
MATKWNDLKHKSSPEVRANLRKEAHAELGRIGFHKLRQAREQTQVAIAARLNISQSAVSRLENQSDFLVSTLREYVGALGGRLELRAVFPDTDFVIETRAPATSAQVTAARRLAAMGGSDPTAEAAPRRRENAHGAP